MAIILGEKMINFNSDKKESQVLTISKDGQDFKFEIERPQDLLNALNFMFKAEAAGKDQDALILLDEAWSFKTTDRSDNAAIGTKGSAEKVFKMLELAEKSGLKPDIKE